MDAYHIALFLHIVTLIAAGGATAVTKLAAGRRIRARTVGEALEWHTVMMSAAKMFPICSAAFVITGLYMTTVARMRVWSSGFVVAGLVGVALLLGFGAFLGNKAKGLQQVLQNIAKNGIDLPAPKLAPPPLVTILPVVNTVIALSVAFDMVTKPASIPVALTIVAIGPLVGVAAAMRRRPAPAAGEAAARVELA